MIIRPYRPTDAEESIAMWRASVRAAFPYVAAIQAHTLAEDTYFFQHRLAPQHDIWLAEAQWRIVGLLAIQDDFIDQLFVAVDAQRGGVGSRLLAKAKALSPARYTFQKNSPARAFYEKQGFTAVQFGTSPPPENEPDVQYEWLPNPPEPKSPAHAPYFLHDE